MKAEFLNIIDKTILFEALKKGDNEALNIIINEIDRLECIIKTYETAMFQISNAIEKPYVKSAELQKKAIKNL